MSWVVDMKRQLEDAEPSVKVEKWSKHCIFRVPSRFKMVDSSVYKPHTVPLGPFHHGDQDLKSMEEHKLRADRHLLCRDSRLTLDSLVAGVGEVAHELEDAYMDLGDQWRGKNRGKFLQMMITDGCFLLEVMRTAATLKKKDSIGKDYPHDPVFSWHGIQHIKPFVQRDMLMTENQLPLRLLEKIVAVEDGKPPSTASINSMVLKFLGRKDAPAESIDQLGLHPLDIYRTSQFEDRQTCVEIMSEVVDRWERALVRSAQNLTEAGIRFLPNRRSCLNHICLQMGKLHTPKVQVHDSTAYMFRNMMAFEAMHVGTSNEVTAYVLFLKDLVDSAHDVRLLARNGVLEHDLANDNAVVWLLNGLTRDVTRNWENQMPYMDLHLLVENHCITHKGSNCFRLFLYESWACLRNKYLRNAWTLLALVTAALLLLADIVQAVYAVKSYYEPGNKGKSTGN